MQTGCLHNLLLLTLSSGFFLHFIPPSIARSNASNLGVVFYLSDAVHTRCHGVLQHEELLRLESGRKKITCIGDHG